MDAKPTYSRTDEVLLDIRNVSHFFGQKQVLRDVCAQVLNSERDGFTQGEVISFLGPSGIGKSVLAKIIAGLLKPTQGAVVGRKGTAFERGDVCMVPQNYPMFEYTTVAQNLLIAGKQAGLDKIAINEKASVFIEKFGLKEHLGKYPKELSGGTKQRVAIARQMMCASNYLLLDEPFSGLDPIMKKAATEAIVQVSQLDTFNTIILVTHDITEGLSVSDTVWLMGYEKNSEGAFMPGARIVDQFDLAKDGFAWRPDILHDHEFLEFVAGIKDRFQTLR